MPVDVVPRAAGDEGLVLSRKDLASFPGGRREGGGTGWERRVGDRGCSESSHGARLSL